MAGIDRTTHQTRRSADRQARVGLLRNDLAAPRPQPPRPLKQRRLRRGIVLHARPGRVARWLGRLVAALRWRFPGH